MYLQCKYGFVEADAWDGTPVPVKSHQKELERVRATGLTPIIVRARRREVLTSLCRLARIEPTRRFVRKSPPGWDYEWRMYVSNQVWGYMMRAVAMDLDYRNFKKWCAANSDDEHSELAHDIWGSAFARLGDK